MPDHHCTQEPICPYCGHENDGSEFMLVNNVEETVLCDRCSEEFLCEMHVTEVNYSTRPLKGTEGA